MFAVDEVVDHAALNGAGAVEGVESGEIFDAGGLIAAKDVAHAVGFKLEDGGGVAAGEKFVGGFVVEGEAVEFDLYAAILLDHLYGVVEDGEGGEAEKVHLEEADALESVHVVLRGDFVAVGLVNGEEFGEGLRGDDHAGGVRGGVPREPFQAQCHFHQILELFVGVHSGLQLRGFLESGIEFNAESGGNEFGEAIHLEIGDVHGAADILNGGFGGHGAEGDDLRDIVAAVFLGDVFDELAAAAHAEVDIDIGHGDALGIEEPLEE